MLSFSADVPFVFTRFHLSGRYIGDLEAALLSLVLHILLALVLDGHDAPTASGPAATAVTGATAALLAEHADELLVGPMFDLEQEELVTYRPQ